MEPCDDAAKARRCPHIMNPTMRSMAALDVILKQCADTGDYSGCVGLPERAHAVVETMQAAYGSILEDCEIEPRDLARCITRAFDAAGKRVPPTIDSRSLQKAAER